MCSLLGTKMNMNSSTILNEDQVQVFFDDITQKNGEWPFNFLKYLTFEWQVSPIQRKSLQHLREILDINVPDQAILFLFCSKGLNELRKGMRMILLRNNISLQNYLEPIKLIVLYGKGFQFNENEIEIIANRAVELLKKEIAPSLRVLCVNFLFYYLYKVNKSRCFVTMRHYLRDFVVLDISSITDFDILYDYYQAAYFFFSHFCETDSDLVEIRDLLIDTTRQKIDDFSIDFPQMASYDCNTVNPESKKKICFLSHKTDLYTPYANTRTFYSFLKGLYSSSSNQFDFYWYTLEAAADETVEELRNVGIKVRRFDRITNLKERTTHLLNAFNNDKIDVVINDYPDFLVILLYSIRVAPLQIYFPMGFIYFEFKEVDLSHQFCPQL